MRIAIFVAGLAFLAGVPAWAGETVTEHETIEKRSMKVETVPAQPTTTTRPARVVEQYQETETRRVEQQPPTIERRTTVEVPAPTVREKTIERTETDD
jgi:hypothetical protein